MTRSKKELAKLKETLRKEDPEAFKKISKRGDSKRSKKDIIKKSNIPLEKPKKVIQWNFKVNQLVKVHNPYTKEYSYGLIVADEKFHSSTLEKNKFFVLTVSGCMLFDGHWLSIIDV